MLYYILKIISFLNKYKQLVIVWAIILISLLFINFYLFLIGLIILVFFSLRFRINRWIKRYPVYFNNKSIKDKRLYYILSEKLFLDDLIIDSNGVVINNYCNIGLKYNPAYIAWFGMQNLNKYVLNKDKKNLDIADKQIIWLIKNIKIENDGAKIYYKF